MIHLTMVYQVYYISEFSSWMPLGFASFFLFVVTQAISMYIAWALSTARLQIRRKLLRNNRYSYSLTKVFNGNNSKKDQREDQFSLWIIYNVYLSLCM